MPTRRMMIAPEADAPTTATKGYTAIVNAATGFVTGVRPLTKAEASYRPPVRIAPKRAAPKPAVKKPAAKPAVTYHPPVAAHTTAPAPIVKPAIVAPKAAPDYTRAIEIGILAFGAFMVLVLLTRRKGRR